MEDSSVKVLRLFRNLVVWLTILGGFIFWLFLPVQVPIHFDMTFTADRFGSKVWLLFLFLIPLFAYIPYSIPEYHLDSKESRLAIKKRKRVNAIIQLITAVIEVLIVWTILFASL